jgi:RNA-directed DNA polymerase
VQAVSQEKTKIIYCKYCKDSNRKGKHERIEFDFLGFSFRPRLAKNKQGSFSSASVLPSVVRLRKRYETRCVAGSCT